MRKGDVAVAEEMDCGGNLKCFFAFMICFYLLFFGGVIRKKA